MISIVLPTYLGAYKYAASGREWKLARAIQSCINQYFQDWQLIVVCDGCERSMEIVKENPDSRIKALLIEKQPLFSGTPRNTGIEYSDGDWICYLDNDDFLAKDHLSLVSEQMNGFDWLFFNDWILRGENFQERTCFLKKGKCGTSNIAHKKSMKARWERNARYGTDDWMFINSLMSESSNWKKIDAEYLVCHVPYGKGFEI